MSIESLMLDTGMKLEPKIDHVPLFGVYVVDTDSHLYVMDDFGSLVSLTNETFAFASNAFYRFSS
jgi:hypothetical protein